jgi:hypothetical protein
MKPSVAIALIVCGTLIVLAPSVSDYFQRANLTRLMEKPEITGVNLEGSMGDLSRIACYTLGGLMILTAIGCSIGKCAASD